jgi:hypothetical protein
MGRTVNEDEDGLAGAEGEDDPDDELGSRSRAK